MRELDRGDQVDADHGLDLVGVERVKAALQLDGGVIDENVDASELGCGRRGDLPRGTPTGEIDRGNRNLAVTASQLLREPGERWFRAGDQQQVRGPGREGPRDAFTDAV